MKEAVIPNAIMQPLHLNPLLCLRSDEGAATAVMERDGFVDDTVVQALLTGPFPQREVPDAAECILPADDLDYAGWRLPATAPSMKLPPAASFQRATPPNPAEPGLGQPHRGHHRWWLASLAGAISTLLVSTLLFTLSARLTEQSTANPFVETPAKPQPVTLPLPVSPKVAAPQLTDATP